jgi:hypothetical protein
MSFLCTLFSPQMSNFWENVVTSFYLTSQAKLNLYDNFWSWPTVSNFRNEMHADGWMNNHKLITDFCTLCKGC